MYFEEYHPKYFNAYLFKLVHDFDEKRSLELFKGVSLEENIEKVCKLCLKTIAPGTRFYTNSKYNENSFEYGGSTFVLKSKYIREAFVLKSYLQSLSNIKPEYKHIEKELGSSIFWAKDTLNGLYRWSSGCLDFKICQDKYGIPNRLFGTFDYLGDAYVLGSLIAFISYFRDGVVMANKQINELRG